jgi:basic membrane protein A
MSHQSRRGGRKGLLATVLAVVACAAIATGCGSSNSSSGGSATTGGGGGGGGKGLKVAILLPGSVSDQGFNADGQRTAALLKSDLGADVTTTQGVQLPNQTDVYSQFARQGYDVVIGWGGQFTDGAVAAAPRFPKTQFIVTNSNIENGKNVSSVDENIEQWQYLGGYAAGKLTKSGTVGWIGGQCFPATSAQLNGTKQGAEAAKPGVKFLSTFTGDFEDPTKAQQGAQAMIDKGADVLVGNLNNGYFGVYKAAQGGKGVKVITEWADNHTQSPSVIASTVVKKQGAFVLDLVKKAQAGSLGGKHYQFALPKNGEPVIAKTPLLPDAIYKDALATQKKVADGAIKVNRVETCPK